MVLVLTLAAVLRQADEQYSDDQRSCSLWGSDEE